MSTDLDPKTIDFLTLLDQLEDYINGRDRMELIKSIKDAEVHIFGSGSEGWKHALKKSKNVTVHDLVPYDEALNMMRQSKIVLNSVPSIKAGAHERIFAGIASGAAVLTNDNLYMHENFKHGEDILFYQNGHWDEVNQSVNEYLNDENKRLKLVKKGQEVVRNGHTWDHRAATLVSELGPILHKFFSNDQHSH
jgi:spore maturation protein CgeB